MATLFKNGVMITGTGEVIDPGWLTTADGMITGMGPMATIDSPPLDEHIDLHGRVLMPGLIDCHVHLVMDGSPDPTAPLFTMNDSHAAILMMNNAWKALQAGFTTVRDLGCLNHVGLSVRDAIHGDMIKGPRLLCAGQMICMTGGHGWQLGLEADGPQEVRKAVRKQLKAGVDVVKLMATGGVCTQGVEPGQTQYSLEEMRAGVEEAHKAGVPAAAHAQGLEGVKIALRAGVDTIEHGMNLDDEAIEMMLAQKATLIPTLAAGAHIIANGPRAGIPDYIVEKSKRHRDERIQSFQKAHQAGVFIAMGTDAGTPFNMHGQNAFEFTELSAAGMSAHDIIIATTRNAARALKIEDVAGSLEIGKQANLLILKQNPLNDIRVLLQTSNIVDIRIAGEPALSPANFQIEAGSAP